MRKQLACSVLQKFNVVLIDRIKQKNKKHKSLFGKSQLRDK